MSVVVKKIREIPAYEGANAIPGIRFRAARKELGVEAWGMNVLELDPGCEGHPEHDHTHDGQEELYVVLEGSVVLLAEGTERVLAKGDMARVGPEVRRKLVTRDESAVLLALGGTPGKPYALDPRIG